MYSSSFCTHRLQTKRFLCWHSLFTDLSVNECKRFSVFLNAWYWYFSAYRRSAYPVDIVLLLTMQFTDLSVYECKCFSVITNVWYWSFSAYRRNAYLVDIHCVAHTSAVYRSSFQSRSVNVSLFPNVRQSFPFLHIDQTFPLLTFTALLIPVQFKDLW